MTKEHKTGPDEADGRDRHSCGADSSDQLIAAADAIRAGGVRAIEVTMTTPGAMETIRTASRRYRGETLFGAGTVLDPETARAAILAGADFVVAPTFDPETVALCLRYGVPVFPGCYTPTEMLSAWEAGASMIKLFPAEIGGPAYIKAVRAPLPQLEIVPVGRREPGYGSRLHQKRRRRAGGREQLDQSEAARLGQHGGPAPARGGFRGRGRQGPGLLIKGPSAETNQWGRLAMSPGEVNNRILDSDDPTLYEIRTKARGPEGRVPINEDLLRHAPSGNLFAFSQNAGMGWNPSELGRREFLILSTQGGIRAPDGRPLALGYHVGHWEVGLLMQAAAEEIRASGCIPYAAYCTDPCDGRTQGTPGMMDSLPYRNDAAQIFRRQIRSLPTRRGVMGVATCDKGLPAMMMALASTRDLPCVLVPGGVTLPPAEGEDAGTVQSIGSRFAHGEATLEDAAEALCRACASPGGGCQFLGTAATAQVVGEALGLALPHSALAPSGQGDMARHGSPVGPGASAPGEGETNHGPAADREIHSQCHGRACRLWRVHQPAPAPPGHRPWGRTTASDGG